jgi:hypothetical protein
MIAAAARSLTKPPYFAALPSMVQPVRSDPAPRRISSVLPIAASAELCFQPSRTTLPARTELERTR